MYPSSGGYEPAGSGPPGPPPGTQPGAWHAQQPGQGTWPAQQPGQGTWPAQQPGQGSWPAQQPGQGSWPAQQPGPFPVQPPTKRRSKAPLIIGIVAVACLAICGLGVVVVAVADNSSSDAKDATSESSLDPSTEAVQGDLTKYKAGDCLTIDGANKVTSASCTTKSAYKVLLRKDGTTSDAACENTEATNSLYQKDTRGSAHDFVLCIAPVG
jgi:hypothetical protein